MKTRFGIGDLHRPGGLLPQRREAGKDVSAKTTPSAKLLRQGERESERPATAWRIVPMVSCIEIEFPPRIPRRQGKEMGWAGLGWATSYRLITHTSSPTLLSDGTCAGQAAAIARKIWDFKTHADTRSCTYVSRCTAHPFTSMHVHKHNALQPS